MHVFAHLRWRYKDRRDPRIGSHADAGSVLSRLRVRVLCVAFLVRKNRTLPRLRKRLTASPTAPSPVIFVELNARLRNFS